MAEQGRGRKELFPSFPPAIVLTTKKEKKDAKLLTG
jgi:hypothetical protein